MNFLVTGGLGVNGSWVTRKLIERGFRPVVMEIRKDLSIIGADYADRMEVVIGDCADQALLRDTLQRHRIERIIHMAAIVGSAQKEPAETFRVNAMGTVMLFDEALRAGIRRVVFTSSRGVYGPSVGEAAHPTYRPVKEGDPQRPTLVYDVCKSAPEGIGRNYAKDHGLEFVALRFSQIYGPGKVARHGNYGVLSRIIEGPVRGEAVEIAKGGDQRDDMIYVDDVAEGTVLAALHDRPRYTEYNISRGIGTTLHDLADAVRAAVPGAQIKIGGGLDYLGFGVNYSCIMDNTRAVEDLGFQAKFDLPSAVRDYVAQMKRLNI